MTGSSAVTTRYCPLRYSKTWSPSSSRLPPCAMTTSSGSVSSGRAPPVVTRDSSSPSIGVVSPGWAWAAMRSRSSSSRRECARHGSTARRRLNNPIAADRERIGQDSDRSTAERSTFAGTPRRRSMEHHATRPLRHPRPLRPAGQPVRPRRDDLRRGPRRAPGPASRSRSRSSRPTSTAAATSSTPRTSTPTATPRRSSATGFAARPGRRDRVVLASKFFGNMLPRRPQRRRRGPRARSSRSSRRRLRRLRTDYLDLYWLHNWDRNTPDRGDHARPRRPRPRRQDPLHRVLQHAGLGHRPGADHWRCCGAGRR